jgi:hypothetical protein
LEQTDIEKDFLNRTEKAQHLRERMNKWEWVKLNSFYTTKETVTNSRDSSQNGRKYLPAIHSIKN